MMMGSDYNELRKAMRGEACTGKNRRVGHSKRLNEEIWIYSSLGFPDDCRQF